MGLLGNKGKRDLNAVCSMVERVIRELGLDPDENRLETQQPGHAWGIMKGSAEVFIFILPSEDSGEPHSIQKPILE